MSKYINVNLVNNKGYSWYKYEKGEICIFVKGFYKVNGEYIREDRFAKFLYRNLEQMKEFIKDAEGQFSFVISAPSFAFAAVDMLRSFPLIYYKEASEEYVVTDLVDEQIIKTHEIRQDTIAEFRHALFVFENKTLLENIYQIPASSYLLIDRSGSSLRKYWNFEYAKDETDDIEKAVQILEKGYDQLFSEIKTLVDEKKVLIPLSGGYDSRLILSGLLKAGVDKNKIVTFTYGDPNYIDVKISKEVATKARVEHHFIPYNRQSRKFYKKYIKDFFLYAGNAISVPCMQEWYALHKLKTMGIVDSDTVIISGYGGVLPGHYIKKVCLNPDSKMDLIHNIKNELSDFIFQKHFGNDDEIRNEMADRVLKSSYFASAKGNLLEQYENWVFEEEQAKFIQNAVRDYEDIGCKWITPFFFRQQFELWGSISNSLRIDNIAFKKCMESYYFDDIRKVRFTGSKEKQSKKGSKGKKYIFIGFNLIFNRKKIHYIFAMIPTNIFWKNEIKKLTISPNDIIAEEYLKWLRND